MTTPGDLIQSARRNGYTPGPMVKPPDFTRRSACKDAKGHHDGLLFPTRPPSDRKLQQVRFLFCNGCPVSRQCEALGRSTGSEGIWGGEYLKGSAEVRDAALKAEVISRVKAGETDGSISRMTGTSTSAISDWRAAEGLAPNLPYGAEARSA